MDVSLLIIGGLASIGYYLNRNDRDERETLNLRSRVPDSEIPTNYNTYENNNYTNIIADRQNRADRLNRQSKNPESTGIIPALYNLRNAKNSSKKKLLVLPPFGDNPKKSKKTANKLSRTKQNISPVSAAYRTKPEELGGFAKENFHNNMVPFFRGSQPKQDMRFETQSGNLERMTGVGDIMYKSKSERGTFHEIDRNDNVFTTPLITDISLDRTQAIVSHKKQGELLHQPINVAPSTSGKPGILGNEGFHPMYRPEERSVDELRSKAKPKLSLDTRERVPISRGTQNKGQSRPEFHQNNPPREHQTGLQYAVAKAAGITADRSRGDASIFVPINSRATTSHEYKGAAGGVNREQGYLSKDNHRNDATIRSQTSNSDYRGGAAANGNEQAQLYNTNPHRTTTKQTTQVEYAGNFGDNKDQGYRIANYDAQVTGRDTTHSGYTPIAHPTAHGEFTTRDNVYNIEINALKSLTSHQREPLQERASIAAGATQQGATQNFRSIRHLLKAEMPKFKNSQPMGKLDQRSCRPLNTSGTKDSKQFPTMNVGIQAQMAKNPYTLSDNGQQPRSTQK